MLFSVSTKKNIYIFHFFYFFSSRSKFDIYIRRMEWERQSKRAAAMSMRSHSNIHEYRHSQFCQIVWLFCRSFYKGLADNCIFLQWLFNKRNPDNEWPWKFSPFFKVTLHLRLLNARIVAVTIVWTVIKVIILVNWFVLLYTLAGILPHCRFSSYGSQ